MADIVDVPLPRPRGPEVRLDHVFAELTTNVWETLRDCVREEEVAS